MEFNDHHATLGVERIATQDVDLHLAALALVPELLAEMDRLRSRLGRQ